MNKTKTLDQRLDQIMHSDTDIKNGTVFIKMLIECSNWTWYYRNMNKKTDANRMFELDLVKDHCE